MQMDEDFSRADAQAYRVEQEEEALNKVTEMKASRDYFADIIKYYNAKLKFFEAMEEALDFSNEEDYNFYMQIQPEKNKLWDMLDSLNTQLNDAHEQVSNAEFEKFTLE